MTIPITFNLPEELVEEAQTIGLLEDSRMITLLRDQIERERQINELSAMVKKIRAVEPSTITPEEIAEEIRLAREEKRDSRCI